MWVMRPWYGAAWDGGAAGAAALRAATEDDDDRAIQLGWDVGYYVPNSGWFRVFRFAEKEQGDVAKVRAALLVAAMNGGIPQGDFSPYVKKLIEESE